MSQLQVHVVWLKQHPVCRPHKTWQKLLNPIPEQTVDVKQWFEAEERVSSAPEVAQWDCCPWLEQCEKLQFQLILRDQTSVTSHILYFTT